MNYEEYERRQREDCQYRFWSVVYWPWFQLGDMRISLQIWLRRKLKRPAARLLLWTLFMFEQVEMNAWTDLDTDEWLKQDWSMT